jgi:endonuclease I
MFSELDNRDGKVTLIYTGEAFSTRDIPNGDVVNTEHVWPQSLLGSASGRARADLHHLFPCRASVNSARSHFPFADVEDTKTSKWFRSATAETTIPAADVRDAYSELGNAEFEPAEADKGNVVRALFYVYMAWGEQGLQSEWIQPQITTLLAWNDMDAPDALEKQRSQRIKEIQGTENPFVIDPTLARRVFAPDSTRTVAALGVRTNVVSTAREIPVLPSVRVAQWNANGIYSVSKANGRSADFQRFSATVAPDVLSVNEFASIRELLQIADLMGFESASVASSDFDQDRESGAASIEVGVISRYPISSVTEFDSTPDNSSAEGDPHEVQLVIPSLPGIERASVSRGFLRVQIESQKLMIYTCHLKSSRRETGDRDRGNAEKREAVAASISAQVRADSVSFPGYTFIILGDMNVGETDTAKNGSNLTEDHVFRTGDRYDDTHAIFSKGLAGGLPMVSKTRNLGVETFDSTEFVGTGPIDVIYLAGEAEKPTPAAVRGNETFGSDH